MREARPPARPRKTVAPAGRISVLLVDDHAAIREGIHLLLEPEPDIVIVGDAKDGVQAVAMTRRLDPDVVLMDIAMPRMNGIEATRRIHAMAPRSRVLILSAHSDDDYIRAVIAMGAVGYVLKESSLGDLAGAIRKTGKGGTVVDSAIRIRQQELTPRPGRAGGPPAKRGPRPRSR